MSRIVTHNESVSSNTVSFSDDHSYYALTNPTQGYGSSSSTNYASINLTRGKMADTYVYWEFNISTIPSNATITSIACNYKARTSNASTSYISSAAIQLCSNYVTKGSSKSILTTSTNASSFTSTEIGTWSVGEINDGVSLKLTGTRGNSRANSNYYIYAYGADITINYSWYETFYSVSTSSNVQGVSISSTSDETLEGGSNTITLSNVSDITTIMVMDNGNDITSLFTRSGSNYTYTLTNINADHTIVVDDNSSSSSKKSYVKKNNSFVETTNQYVKESNSWINRTISKIFWKINGNWTETNDSMSGKTAFKIDV